jgi:hypothetical protein
MTQREIFLLEEYLAENIDIAAATQTNIQRVPESAWARTPLCPSWHTQFPTQSTSEPLQSNSDAGPTASFDQS